MGKKNKATPSASASSTNTSSKKGSTTDRGSLKKTSSYSKFDDDIPRVNISNEIEEKLADLIQKHLKENFINSKAVQRLTKKKLSDVYERLQTIGFQAKEIEAAMMNTSFYGGNIVDALDWLCLFTPDEKLPEGFSQALNQEIEKARPHFDKSQQLEVSCVAEDSRNTQQPLPKTQTEESKKKAAPRQQQGGENLKSWILQYADQSSGEETSSEEEDSESKQEPAASGPAQENLNEEYLDLLQKIKAAKITASEAKQAKDGAKQKQVSGQLQKLNKRKGVIEHSPGFDSRLMETECQKPKNIPAATTTAADDDDDDGGGMAAFFDEDNQKQNPKKKAPVKKSSLDIRNFEYTRQQWTGKSPKQFLIDWVRKNLSGSPAPKYHKIQVRGDLWQSRCVVERKKAEPIEVCPSIVTKNIKDAEHLASTLALYQLCRGQKIYQLLPPPYRDVWLSWQQEESDKKTAEEEKENKPKVEFIQRLLTEIKKSGSAVQSKPGAAVAGAVDSWEDLADSAEPTLRSADKSNEKVKVSKRICTNEEVRNTLHKCSASDVHNKLLHTRQKLPIYPYREELLSAIGRNQVVIVAGETGSGKSTQVPQFLLEHLTSTAGEKSWNIICTQPRRLSAVSLATRVCEELGSSSPGVQDSLCGYQIRLESKVSSMTRLVYCTTGVVLRQIQTDPDMKFVSHIIVDEVHERSVESDFLLIILKKMLKVNTHLKVILMSATLDAEKFSRYFSNCPTFQVPGRTFHVQVHYLEDVIEQTGFTLDNEESAMQVDTYQVQSTGKRGTVATENVTVYTEDLTQPALMADLDPEVYCDRTRSVLGRWNEEEINLELIVELLHYIGEQNFPGATLVFLPGLMHIQQLYDLLSTDSRFNPRKQQTVRNYLIIPLHSELANENQTAAFVIPPRGTCKVVLATNIAETGITIPDVTVVIDAGKVKEKRYSESTQMSSLREVWISQASAKQRCGRAGRVQDGLCFRLYSKNMFDTLSAYSTPEMLRVPLEELCLLILKCNYGDPATFLTAALDPPTTLAVSRAMDVLMEVGAVLLGDLLPGDVQLTPLGHHLAALPVNVRVGKMLIYAAILGCLEHMCIIAASMTEKSMFVPSVGKRKTFSSNKVTFATACSDHLTNLHTYLSWLKVKQTSGKKGEIQFCRTNNLRRNTLFEIEKLSRDMNRLVHSCGFQTSRIFSPSDLTFEDNSLLKAALTAGLYPKAAKIKPRFHIPNMDGDQEPCREAVTPQGIVHLHDSSVNAQMKENVGYILYSEKERGSRVFIRDNTLVSPCPLLIFGGTITVEHHQRLINVDSWISFKAHAKTGVVMKKLRLLIDAVLLKKLENPQMKLHDDPIICLLKELIISETNS